MNAQLFSRWKKYYRLALYSYFMSKIIWYCFTNVLLPYQFHRHQEDDLLDIKFFYKKNIKLFKNYLNQLVLIDIKQGCQGDFLDIKNVSLTLKDVNSFNIQHLTVKKRFCP